MIQCRWPALLSMVAAFIVFAAPSTLAQQTAEKSVRQYKRVHQRALKRIVQGQAETAVADLRDVLKILPDDAESHFMLAVAHAQLNQPGPAVAASERALQLGLPPGRLAGGTQTLLEPIQDQRSLAAIRQTLAKTPVHGPMLGCLSGDGVEIWLRTIGAVEVSAAAWKPGQLELVRRSRKTRTNKESDFTARLQIDGLDPDTRYDYHVEIDSVAYREATYHFRTLAQTGQPTRFRLAFGGGAGYVPGHERMWDTIRSKLPDVLLLLGDNIYSDDPTTPEMQHYCYYRRQSRPEYRRLLASTPVFSIWDDHDFGTNDCSGGPEVDVPAWKLPVWRVFRNNWVNPYYGGGETQPGCYYDFYLGDVHFVMLDGRYYRNLKPQDNGRASMLGPAQRKWLLETIHASKGRLLFLCSPVPWVFHAKGDSRDTWNGFRDEREEIFDFLTKKNIPGVVLLSADRHRSDLWKIERPGDYALYEFNSSRLTNQHVHATMQQALFSYNAKQSFGLVDVDTTADDPTVTYRVVSIDGEVMHEFTLRRSQLMGR